jgi:hypothetical protein
VRGLTSTRTVIIQAANAPSIVPSADASTNPSNFYGSINLAAEAQADNESSDIGNNI